MGVSPPVPRGHSSMPGTKCTKSDLLPHCPLPLQAGWDPAAIHQSASSTQAWEFNLVNHTQALFKKG